MENNPKKRYCRINTYKKRSRNKEKPMESEVSDEAKFKLARFISDVRKYSECVKKEEKNAQYLKRKKTHKPEHKIDTSLQKGIFGNGIIGDEVYPSVKDILGRNKKKRNNSFKNVTTDSQNDKHSFLNDSSIGSPSPTQDNRHISPREIVLEKSSQPKKQSANKKPETITSECPCKHAPNTWFEKYSDMTKVLLENCTTGDSKKKEIEQQIKEIHLKYYLSLANPNLTDEEASRILKTIENSGMTLLLLPATSAKEETSFRTREKKEENVYEEDQNILRKLNSSPEKWKKDIDSSEKHISDFPAMSPSKCKIPSTFRTPPSGFSELPFTLKGQKEASRGHHVGMSPKKESFLNSLKLFGVKPIKASPVRPSVSDTTARLTAMADQLLNSPVKVRSPVGHMSSSPDIIYPSPEISRKFNYLSSPKLNFCPTTSNCQNYSEPPTLVSNRIPFSKPEPINFPMDMRKEVRGSFPFKDMGSPELTVPHLKSSLDRCNISKLVPDRESSTMNQFWENSTKSIEAKLPSVTLSPPMVIHNSKRYCQQNRQPHSSAIFQDTSFSTGLDSGLRNLDLPHVKFSPHSY